jgi:hypothetical protein
MATLLSADDLERMKMSAATSVHEVTPNEWNDQKKYLQKMSAERAGKWGNTIAAQRRAKEQAKKNRLESQEMEKRVLDQEEAQIQAQLRQDAIERAQRMLYEDSDKVKTFSSGMLLSDVCEERQAQIALSHTKRQIEAAEEEEWFELQQKQWSEHDQRETSQEVRVRAKLAQEKVMRKEQIVQTKTAIIQRQKAAQREGQAILANSQEELQRQKQELLDKKEAARKAQEETARMNKLLQERRERERAAIEMEERKIEEYAETKENLAVERKERAEMKFREEMAIRQKMIDRANAHLASLNTNENKMLSNQIAQREKADSEREGAKAAFRAREMEACDLSRSEQLRLRRERKEQDKRENAELSEQWKASCENLKEEELQEILDQKDYSKAIQQFQLRQVAEKQRRKAKVDARNEMGAIRDIVRAQEVDDQFNVYAEACIDEYAQVSALISIFFCERRQETESKARASALGLAAATRVFTAFVSSGGQGPQAAADRAEEGDGPQLHEPPDQVVVLKKQHMCKSIY